MSFKLLDEYGHWKHLNKILPFILFPTISYYALNFIFLHGIQAGTFERLTAQCTGTTSYTLSYTGVPKIDGELCGMVAFFHILKDPRNLLFNVELITAMAAIVTIPYFEAARQNRNVLLEFQWVIGVIYQRFTGGVILPFYWLLFVVTGMASLHHTRHAGSNSKIVQERAESIIFALVAGFIVPSLAMFMITNQYVTAFWQAFPLWMYIAQLLYLSIRPASGASGASTVYFTYMALFLFSLLPHLYILTTILFSSPNPLSTFKSLFVPSLALLDPIETTFNQGVMDFIKWDYMMMLVSTFVATVWVVGWDMKCTVGLVTWWAVSVPLFGAGASIIGVFWWRERLLNEAQKEREIKHVKDT